MKLTAEILELIKIRPAVYSGTEYEFVISFSDESLARLGIEKENALDMQVGNTACLYGTVLFGEDSKDDSDSRKVYLFLTGDVLDDFIEQYGHKKINGDFSVRGEFIYKTYSETGFYDEDKEEIGGFVLTEIHSVKESEAATDLETYQLSRYFEDGIK